MDRLKLVIAYCIACIPIKWIDGSIAVDFAEIPCIDVPSWPFASVDCSAAIRRVSEVKRTRRRHQLPAGLPSEVEAPSCHFGRRHPRANKLCKRQASRYRPHTPSRRRRPQQGPSSDRRRTAFAPLCRRRMRAGSAQAPCHPPMRTAAIRVRRSSMHRRSGTRWHQARRVASINRSLDLELHCGLFSPIALDLILDGLSLVERA